jgi:hypothetical protein
MLRQRRLGRGAVRPGEHEHRVSDQVLCRRNDNRLGLRNGMRGTVVKLEEEALIVRDQTGRDRRVPFAYAAEHLEYGYALTGHAAQGLTVDRAYILLRDQGALKEWGYAACSRARLYLSERDSLDRETPLRPPDPAALPDRVARALHHSAAEPLALDQRRQQPDTILTYVAQQQEQLNRNRERTVERLAVARRELQALHWWNGDRRAELQAEIALQQTVLERADAKREQLRRLAERRTRMRSLARERDELAPSLRPEPLRPGLEREPPGLGLDL